MSTQDMGGRRIRHSSTHYNHLRSRHHSSKYDVPQGGSSLYNGLGQLPSSLALAKVQTSEENIPYTVTEFSMCVQVDGRPVHHFSQLTSNSRLSDLIVNDTTSWHKQYPEFNFHRTDELKKHHVLVCDASIKIMTMERPQGAKLDVDFDLRSQVDLAVYDSLECRTRFFDNGKPAYYFDEHKRKVKETHTEALYLASPECLLRLKFGANFWAQQLQKLSHILRKAGEEEQSTRVKYEKLVREELQYMTAAQDIYGVKNGEVTCVLTVLWRFNQTRSSHDPGRVSWRVVDFGRRERRWVREEDDESRNTTGVMVPMMDPSIMVPPMATSTGSIYPSLPLDFPIQPLSQHAPPLDLDALGFESISSDFSNPNSASVPSLATDYSQAHPEYPDTNDFDFNGGHITISGCLEPAINLGAYESYGSQHSHDQALGSLHSLAGLAHHDPHTHTHQNDGFSDLGLDVSVATCYATKPSWHHPSLISHLENAAESYSDLVAMQSSGGHVENALGGAEVGHGVLHGLGNDDGIWRLQSAFREDTGVGAHDVGGRKDSVAGRIDDGGGQGHESLLEFMEMGRDEQYRPC
jgi:transcriptional enhancer factor